MNHAADDEHCCNTHHSDNYPKNKTPPLHTLSTGAPTVKASVGACMVYSPHPPPHVFNNWLLLQRRGERVLLYWEEIDDALGAGFRIVTEEDAVYESRVRDDALTATYREGGNWKAKIRLPDEAEDLEQAYDLYTDTATRVTEASGDDLSLTVRSFSSQFERGRAMNQTGDTSLFYNTEPRIDIAPGKLERIIRTSPGAVGYSAITTGFGGVVGSVVGLLGGLGAMAAGAPEIADPILLGSAGSGTALGSGVGAHVAREYYKEKYPRETIKRREYRDKPEQAATLLDDVNRLHHLDEKLKVTDTLVTEEVNTHRELREAAPDDDMNVFLDLFFRKLPRRQGIIATHTPYTYDDATAFIADVTNTPTRDVKDLDESEEPSLYNHPDAYEYVLDWCTYETEDDDGVTETHLLPTGESLIQTALQHDDTHKDIDAFLHDTYPDHTDRLGLNGL